MLGGRGRPTPLQVSVAPEEVDAGLLVAGGGFEDAFGDAVAEFGRGYHFSVAAITEDETFEFVVDHDFKRQLYASIGKALLYFLRFMEWL